MPFFPPVNAPFWHFSDVMCIPSRFLKVLIPHFRVVLRSTPCTEHTIIVEFSWESSLLHSVAVSLSIGVFLISPVREFYVASADRCNHAQHTVVTMLTATLTASGYLSTLAIFTLRHTTVLAARINWRKVECSTVRWKILPGARFTKHRKLVDLVLNYKPDGYFTAKFGSWSETILESKCSRGFDFILLPFFT